MSFCAERDKESRATALSEESQKIVNTTICDNKTDIRANHVSATLETLLTFGAFIYTTCCNVVWRLAEVICWTSKKIVGHQLVLRIRRRAEIVAARQHLLGSSKGLSVGQVC